MSALVRADGGGIVGHDAVQQADDSRGILLCKLGIVRHHNYQLVLGDFLQDFHDLDARCGIQCAGRLVRQQDIRIVDDGTCNGNALHLPAGHLVGLFLHLVAQSDSPERILRTAAAFRLGYTGERQRQLHVCQHALVRDKIVALEYKADAVVTVGVPVAVVKILG